MVWMQATLHSLLRCILQELENVTMLEKSLSDAARTCVGARFQLKLAQEGVSHGGLGLLAKHRKRERLRALLDILRTLKTLVSKKRFYCVIKILVKYIFVICFSFFLFVCFSFFFFFFSSFF